MLESENDLLQRAVQAGLLDEAKGKAALSVFAKLQQMGAKFTFGQFLLDRGLMTQLALRTLETGTEDKVKTVNQLGDFQLIGLIGEGQHGTVFKALQRALDRYVALKVLSPQFAADAENVTRFLHEARAVARVNHPNVVQGIAAGSDHGLHYFAMELVEGGSVRTLIDSGQKIPLPRALEILKQSATGLHAAHQMGILHRDVKPDNILLSKDGQVKMADLGISHMDSTHFSEDGSEFWGTPEYVSPEVIRSANTVDGRSDIYSLGASFFEMLAGEPPFLGETPELTMQMQITESVPEIRRKRSDVTPPIAQLLESMLAKDVDERPLNAAAVADAVAAIVAKKPLSLPPRKSAPAAKTARPAYIPRRAIGGARTIRRPYRRRR